MGAILSRCGTYRYRLWRTLDASNPKRALFVLLNPSTADAETDDNTLRRCMGFARAWGAGRVDVVNLYPLRATDPRELRAHPQPEGPRDGKEIQAAPDGFRPYLMAALHTGARAGELASVAWADVDLDEGLVEINNTKTRDQRYVILTPELAETLERLKAERPRPTIDGRDPVFTLDGRRPIQAYQRRKLWEETRKRAKGLRKCVREGLRWHDLRHSCASLLIARGLSLEVVGQILGHKNARTTRRYSHLQKDVARAAMAELADAFQGAKTTRRA